MSKYVLDKDKFFTKVNEIINDKFIENIETISNRFVDNIEDLPLPRTSPYLDMVSINPNGVVLSSHSLNKFLEYNARLDKVSYYGSNQSIYSSEIEAFLNVKIHKKYINEFILNIIDSNLLNGSDIIVEKFYSDVDSDVYKQMLSYMFRFDSKIGKLLYPVSSKDCDKDEGKAKVLKLRRDFNIVLETIPFFIPDYSEKSEFELFVKDMENAETEFIERVLLH
jgi:hypothetical protein